MRMLIVNPIAGCGYALKVMEQVQSVLTARNLPFRVMRTEYPGCAAKLAREAVEMGCEAVYVIGGDGTFSEAARGLAGSGIPIGLIPAGTGNDFVKTLGTPKEPMAALDFILSHEPRPCDAIDLNGQMFLNVAGAGFDVTVLENVADFGGKIRGLLPYLVGLIRAIWKHQPLKLTYTVNGETRTKDALLCIAANGKWIGGGIPICPDAVPNDGEIDFMVVGQQPRWKVPYYLVRMMMKQILNFPFTEHVLCDKVTVSSPGMVVARNACRGGWRDYRLRTRGIYHASRRADAVLVRCVWRRSASSAWKIRKKRQRFPRTFSMRCRIGSVCRTARRSISTTAETCRFSPLCGKGRQSGSRR